MSPKNIKDYDEKFQYWESQWQRNPKKYLEEHPSIKEFSMEEIKDFEKKVLLHWKEVCRQFGAGIVNAGCIGKDHAYDYFTRESTTIINGPNRAANELAADIKQIEQNSYDSKYKKTSLERS